MPRMALNQINWQHKIGKCLVIVVELACNWRYYGRMENHAKRSVRPDGEKIKSLRKASGLSQKKLVDSKPNVGLGERSYQRAEQGEDVSPTTLDAVAAVLGVSVDEISLDKTITPTRMIRIPRLNPPSASNMVNTVSQGLKDFEIKFELDPEETVAEKLAEITESLDGIHKDHQPGRHWEPGQPLEGVDLRNPGEKIRLIGRMNTTLKSLAEDSVHVFFGSFVGWRTTREVEIEGARGRATPATPQSNLNGKLIFSESSSAYLELVRPYHAWSKEVVYASCIKENLAGKVPYHPADVSSAWNWFENFHNWEDSHVPEWLEKYRTEYVNQFGEPSGEPNLFYYQALESDDTIPF
jgi:transcriptional regulator with XRE-family HTH domain